LQAAVEVEALTPTNPQLAATIESMEERGIGIVYGRWLIEGAPRVILIDTKTAYRFLDEWKADLWNTAGIPSPPGDEETNEAVVFGYLVAWFLGEVGNQTLIMERELTPSSLLHTKRPRRSLLISTNGYPV
jgi:glycogen(starch) synthase